MLACDTSQVEELGDGRVLSPLIAASWNVSAVNTNPFEYWVTHSDPAYNALMTNVQNFIDNPEKDLPIVQILTDSMFSELCIEMENQNIGGLADLQRFWNEEYRSRNAIEGFLKNPQIGVKRLASLPDRITNTIYLADGGVCLRPTVINAYDAPISSKEEWWTQWRDFIFRTKVQVHLYSIRMCLSCMVYSDQDEFRATFALLTVFGR